MHVLIATAGSAGDVYPFIAIGQALAARGHEVELMGARPFAAPVRGAGLGFLPVGAEGDFERIVQAPDLWHPRRGLDLILKETLAQLPAVCDATRAALRRDTLLVGGTLAWNVRLVQEQCGRRAATVHLSPSCFLSAEAPPRLQGLGWLPALPAGLVRTLFWAIERSAIDPRITPALTVLRRSLGLAPVDRVMSRWIHSPDLVVGAWPAWFAAPQADWPPNTVVAGFARWERTVAEGAVAPVLVDFLAEGAPPVGITPGSAMAHGRSFIARGLEACTALGQRALVVTPYADQLPDELPAGCLHVPYVPFEWLVPRLAALVHHGGIGTCAQALAAGVPQLIAPFAHDQHDNGSRIARMGVGDVVPAGAAQRRWNRALGGIVGDPALRRRCGAVRDRLRNDGNAAEHIAGLLEALGAGQGA